MLGRSLRRPVDRPDRAAAAASTPSVNVPERIPCTLRCVLNTRITSVACTPTCQPMLPPASPTATTGRSPLAVLFHHEDAVAKPMTNPPLITFGITATPSASASIDAGIARPGTAMISSKTVTAALMMASSGLTGAGGAGGGSTGA